MKPLSLLLVVIGLAGITLTSAGARTEAAKTTICHRIASKTTPYVKLKVSGEALRAALKRPADIVPAPRAGCPKTVLTPTSGGRTFTVAMTGNAESPAGDPVGTGTAEFHLRAGQGQVCYQISAKNLPPAVAAHIHRGAAGVEGPVVIPLTTPNADGASLGCATAVRSLVKAIIAAPASFYANVHTAEFPAGAIRGQLSGTSTDAFGTVFAFDLRHERAERDRLGGAPHPQGHRDRLLPAARCERHAADGRRAHPQGRRERQRPRRRPVHRTGSGRQLERCAAVDPGHRQRHPRQPAGLLRERAHEGAPGRRDPQPSSADPHICCGGGARARPHNEGIFGPCSARCSRPPLQWLFGSSVETDNTNGCGWDRTPPRLIWGSATAETR